MSQRNASVNIDSETFRRNGYQLIDRIAGFFHTISERPVTRAEQPSAIRSLLGDNPVPASGDSLDTILARSADLLFEHSLHNGHPRFWGYITSSAAPAGVLAELLAASVNANVGAYPLSPIATEIEKQTIRWMAELIGFPKDCGGIFVSGGNMANMTGLLAGRREKVGWDIRKTGMTNHQMLIYCAKGTHTWVQKSG